jgi:hypothetical protein
LICCLLTSKRLLLSAHPWGAAGGNMPKLRTPRDRFVADSALEQTGFEPLVPIPRKLVDFAKK